MKQLRKHSKKRDEILRVIRSTKTHPGAQWVYDQLKPSIPDLSLGTVYRNLGFFREEGLVASLGVVNGEERFDAEVHAHPHLVCGCCGKILDLPCPPQEDLETFAEGFRGAEEGEVSGFSIDYRRTSFYGCCRDCSEVAGGTGG